MKSILYMYDITSSCLLYFFLGNFTQNLFLTNLRLVYIAYKQFENMPVVFNILS